MANLYQPLEDGANPSPEYRNIILTYKPVSRSNILTTSCSLDASIWNTPTVLNLRGTNMRSVVIFLHVLPAGRYVILSYLPRLSCQQTKENISTVCFLAALENVSNGESS